MKKEKSEFKTGTLRFTVEIDVDINLLEDETIKDAVKEQKEYLNSNDCCGPRPMDFFDDIEFPSNYIIRKVIKVGVGERVE